MLEGETGQRGDLAWATERIRNEQSKAAHSTSSDDNKPFRLELDEAHNVAPPKKSESIAQDNVREVTGLDLVNLIRERYRQEHLKVLGKREAEQRKLDEEKERVRLASLPQKVYKDGELPSIQEVYAGLKIPPMFSEEEKKWMSTPGYTPLPDDLSRLTIIRRESIPDEKDVIQTKRPPSDKIVKDVYPGPKGETISVVDISDANRVSQFNLDNVAIMDTTQTLSGGDLAEMEADVSYTRLPTHYTANGTSVVQIVPPDSIGSVVLKTGEVVADVDVSSSPGARMKKLTADLKI